MGSLSISTVEIQFFQKNKNKIENENKQERRQVSKQKYLTGKIRRRSVNWPSNGIVSATQPCYIMDGMGECECCIRQGGLQGRADTEDTPEASPLMPDMLLRLQGFS